MQHDFDTFKPNLLKEIGFVKSEKYIDFIDKHVNFQVNDSYGRKEIFSNCKNCFLIERNQINDSRSVDLFLNISEDIKSICVSTYGEGLLENVQFSLVPPKGRIKEHFDTGLIFSLSHRLHLPIITNEDSFLYIDNNRFNLKVNQLVEINNKQMHFVENNSDYDRIHLIIDYIPKRYLSYL